jgi:hypothetical protein
MSADVFRLCLVVLIIVMAVIYFSVRWRYGNGVAKRNTNKGPLASRLKGLNFKVVVRKREGGKSTKEAALIQELLNQEAKVLVLKDVDQMRLLKGEVDMLATDVFGLSVVTWKADKTRLTSCHLGDVRLYFNGEIIGSFTAVVRSTELIIGRTDRSLAEAIVGMIADRIPNIEVKA